MLQCGNGSIVRMGQSVISMGDRMKIQCGECEKLYNFNTENITAKGVSFNCKQCDNKFTINDSLVLTSTCGKSKIACSNCGKLLHEDIRKCDHCNVKVNKVHEELRIDNNYYEHLNLDDKGTILSEIN